MVGVVAMGSRPSHLGFSLGATGAVFPSLRPGEFLRSLPSPNAVHHWSLRSVQVRLIKMGGRLVHHARRLAFQMILW